MWNLFVHINRIMGLTRWMACPNPTRHSSQSHWPTAADCWSAAWTGSPPCWEQCPRPGAGYLGCCSDRSYPRGHWNCSCWCSRTSAAGREWVLHCPPDTGSPGTPGTRTPLAVSCSWGTPWLPSPRWSPPCSSIGFWTSRCRPREPCQSRWSRPHCPNWGNSRSSSWGSAARNRSWEFPWMSFSESLGSTSDLQTVFHTHFSTRCLVPVSGRSWGPSAAESGALRPAVPSRQAESVLTSSVSLWT